MQYILCVIVDWNVLSAVGTLATAIVAVVALAVNGIQVKMMKKHYDEDVRARLSFSIIEWQDILALKVSNIGKSTAYHIHLVLKSELIDNHYSQIVKEELNAIQQHPISIMSGKSKYYFLTYEYNDKGSSYQFRRGKESFSSQQVNKWLDEHIEDNIHISASYNGRYNEEADVSIKEFLGGLVVTDDATYALQRIAKGLTKSNDTIMPIQTSLDHIAKKVDKMQK